DVRAGVVAGDDERRRQGPIGIFWNWKVGMEYNYNRGDRKTIIVDGVPLPDLLDEQMVHDVVHGFYDKIRIDDLLGPIFKPVIQPEDWPRHLSMMCNFWSAELLHISRYSGKPQHPHLEIPELGAEHIRRWLRHIRATVHALCPPPVA